MMRLEPTGQIVIEEVGEGADSGRDISSIDDVIPAEVCSEQLSKLFIGRFIPMYMPANAGIGGESRKAPTLRNYPPQPIDVHTRLS